MTSRRAIFKNFLFIFGLIFIFIFVGCNQNPFFGVGNSVDLDAPRIEITSHKNLNFVSTTFVLKGNCYDNIGVTEVKVKEKKTGKEWTGSVNKDANSWTCQISMPDGEYEFNVYAYDAAGNSSNESYKVITLTVDSNLPIAKITKPDLTTDIVLKVFDARDFDFIDFFQNQKFKIKGDVSEDFKINSIKLDLIDNSGDSAYSKTIVNGEPMPVGVEGSVWNWTFNIDASTDLKDKTTQNFKLINSKKYYYNVKLTTFDMAGNKEEVDKGYICVYPDSDLPWTKITSIKANDNVTASGLVSGNSYDDDGLKTIYIKIVPSTTVVNLSDYKNWNNADVTIDATTAIIDKSVDKPRLFTWKINAPSKAGTYKIYVMPEDSNGLAAQGYEELTFIVPDVDTPISFVTSHQDQGTEIGNLTTGNFTFAGYSYDNIEVKKLKLAWIPTGKDSSILNTKDAWIDSTGTGAWTKDSIKFWDISASLSANQFDSNLPSAGMGGRWKKSWSKVFNVNTDFTEYADKNFVVYTEDNSGNVSYGRIGLYGDKISPTVTITDPTTDAVYKKASLVESFTISGSWDDNTQNIKTIQVKWVEANVTQNATITGNNWSISSSNFSLTGGPQNFEVTATDNYGNKGYGRRYIIIDNDKPIIKNITSTKDSGTYKAFSLLPITVQFNKTVYVTGTPKLQLNAGSAVFANYSSGSGTTTLTFDYTVNTGDNTTDLDYTTVNALLLNSGTIKDLARNDAILTLPTVGGSNSLGGNKNIVVDTVNPTIKDVTSTTYDSATEDNFNEGVIVTITVKFSETVLVENKPLLKLNVITSPVETRYADYAFGSATDTLTFSYKVKGGDNSAKLDYLDINSLILGNGVTIKDVAGNNAVITLASPASPTSLSANRNIVIDTLAPNPPTVNELSKIAFDITTAEQNIQHIQYSIDNGEWVDYTTGSSVSISLKSSTSIAAKQKDKAGNWSNITVKTIAADTTLPIVVNVNSSKNNGYYKAGELIPITIQFSRDVTIDTTNGIPTLVLETGTVDREAIYFSGNKTSLLTFNYTVQAGDTTLKLDYVDVNSLKLNGGTIKDSLNRNTDLILAAPGQSNSLGFNKNIEIDTTSSTVSNVTSTFANTFYKQGDVIPITIDFSEPVFVTGTPQLLLETGTTDTNANYSLGSGTTTLTFNYTVATGNNNSDLDYVSQASLALNSGTIKDKAGNDATLTLAIPATTNSLGFNKNIIVDTTKPIVTNVTSATSNGSYNEGKTITINMIFSEIVTIAGIPQIQLNSSGTSFANYSLGSGTNTLTFGYTVASGETSADLDYLNTSALTGIIKDLAGNDATLTLPTVGGAGSLGANKNIVIDTTAPLAPLVGGITNNSFVKIDQVFTLSGESGASLKYSLDNGSNWSNYTAGVTISAEGTYQITAKQTDLAGNTSANSTTITVTIDKTAPSAPVIGGIVAGTYNSTQTFTIQGETGASFEYSLNGGTSWSNYTGAVSISVAGTYNVTARQTDKASNTSGNAVVITVVIDVTPPQVTNVSSDTTNGSYNQNKAITVTVDFTKTVFVVGSPRLKLNSNTTVYASYAFGSGTTKLTFSYIVGSGDTAADLDYSSTGALELNSGTIKDTSSNNATLTLPTVGGVGSLGANKNIVIDTAIPSVPVVSGITNNTFKKVDQIFTVSGESLATFQYSTDGGANWIDYTGAVTLSVENVYQVIAKQTDLAGNTSANSTTITVTIDKTAPSAPVIGGIVAGTYNSTQTFTIQGETGATFEYSLNGGTNWFNYSTAVSFSSAGTYNVTARQTDKASNTSGNATTITVIIDVTPPLPTNISSDTANGNYNQNKAITVTVDFTKIVYITGSPRLKLNSNTTVYANYSFGSGTTKLTFSYIVGSGDTAADLDYSSTAALELNSGTIKDSSGNNATLTLPAVGGTGSLGANRDIVIDTTSPSVPVVSGLLNNSFVKIDQIFSISGESLATFQYSTDGGGTWLDYSTNVTLSVENVYQVIARQTDVAGNTSTNSTTITVTIDKTIPDAPQVSGIVGGTYNSARTFSVQGEPGATFEYSLNSGSTWNNYTSSVTVSSAGTYNITARQTDKASNTSGNATTITVIIDVTPPTVTNISSDTANGSYNLNKAITVTVDFSKIVYVTGSPRLKLNSNTTVYASYAFGSGTTKLTFSYIVGSGDTAADLDYSSTAALELNSGTIKDSSGNNATLTLPAVGGTWSLGANKDIVIDTTSPSAPGISGVVNGTTYNSDKTITLTGLESGATVVYSTDNGLNWNTGTSFTTVTGTTSLVTYKVIAKQSDIAGNESSSSSPITFFVDKVQPTVTNVNSSLPNGEYKEGQNVDIDIDFSKTVALTGSPRLKLNTTPTQYATYLSGTNSSRLTFRYTITTGDLSTKLDYFATDSLELNGGTIKDTVGTGNTAILTLVTPGAANSLGSNKNIKVDAVTPTISGVTPVNTTKDVSKSSNLVITFSEPVYKESGTIEIIRNYNKFPVILTIDEYNEWKNKVSGVNLDDYYSLGTIGAPSGVTDTIGKYILKYTYDGNNATLTTAFTDAGYNKISIDVQSTQITGSGTNTITINPNNDMPIGIDFYVNISATAFRDSVGHYFAGISDTSTWTFVTGPVATPIIRINKVSGSGTTQPTQTTYKIDCETNGATIRYTSTNVSPSTSSPSLPSAPADPTSGSTQFVSEITIGTSSSTVGHIERIKAVGFLTGLTQSAVTEEIAFKTVLATKNAAGSGKFIWYRGSNNSGGPTTAPGFPLRWEDNQYSYIKCAAWESGDRWYWITWQINVSTEYKSLWADQPSDWATMGPSVYSWESGSNNIVGAGGYRWEEVKTTYTSGFDNYEAWAAHTRP